jgi:hypothetical protein
MRGALAQSRRIQSLDAEAAAPDGDDRFVFRAVKSIAGGAA